MGACYPDQVGGHKPCEPVVKLSFGTGSQCGSWPRRWSRCLEVDTGPPRTSPVGSESEWPGECHDSRSVLSEHCWST